MGEVPQPHELKSNGGSPMDENSLAHTRWRCKYHIVFAPKFRRKEIYGKIKADIGKILRVMQTKRCRDNRSKCMSGSCTHVSINTAKNKYFKIYGNTQREEQFNDIRQVRKFKIQIWKPTFLVQGLLCRYGWGEIKQQ